MLEFQTPQISAEKVEENRGSFTIEPLDRGFGYTFGNSPRPGTGARPGAPGPPPGERGGGRGGGRGGRGGDPPPTRPRATPSRPPRPRLRRRCAGRRRSS